VPGDVFATLFAETSEGVLAFDTECRYTAWNPAMEHISGLAADAVLGRNAFELFPFLRETGEDHFFREALAGRAAVSRERPYAIAATGRSGSFEGRYFPLRDGSGAVVGGMAFVREVSLERRLRDSQDALGLQARVLQSMREGVSVTDEAGRIVYTNPAEDEMFGYEPGELVGRHVSVLNAYPPGDNERIVGQVIATLRRDGIWVGEWLNRRKDGSTFVSRSEITALATAAGQFWVCVQEDVTRERQVQRALRDTAQQLALATEAAQLGPWSWDANTDLVTLGERAAELFGIPAGPAMTWTRMLELLHDDDREPTRLAVEVAVAERREYDAEYRVRRPDGERWIASRGRAFYDGEGRVIGMHGVVQDVTARKQAEQSLVEETRALAALNRIGQVLSAELDHGKLLQALTDAATELSGAQFGSFFYNRKDESGESYMLYTLSGASPDAFRGFPMPRNTAVFEPTFRGEAVIRIADVQRDPRYGRSAPYHGLPPGHLPVRSYLAVPVVSRSGEVHGGLFFGHASPGMFSERHERLVTAIAAHASIALDNARFYEEARVAERQARERAEALADADRRKDEFLAVLAHELRNPLGAISNALHVIGLGAAEGDRFRRAHDVAVRQVALQSRLVDDLLDVSRIAQGKIRLQVEHLDLAGLLHEVAEDHRTALEGQGLTFVVEPPEAPVAVDGDRARLAQAIGNLLDNARKFTPAGGTVRLSLGVAEGHAAVTVTDTGVGIEPGVLPRLFTPFAQGDRTLARSQGGLGLGLALVKGLVELHPGGAVAVASDGPDRGTTVSLSLPVAASPESVGAAAPKERLRAGLRILVVDDIVDVAESMAELLTVYGCETLVTHTGGAAVEIATREQPDLVLCDIGLPDMDGYETARRLKADPVTAAIPLVALTGYGGAEDQRKSREAGFATHLVKPVLPNELMAAVNRLVGGVSRG
jgi:PAS domain S-box-containing protein